MSPQPAIRQPRHGGAQRGTYFIGGDQRRCGRYILSKWRRKLLLGEVIESGSEEIYGAKSFFVSGSKCGERRDG